MIKVAIFASGSGSNAENFVKYFEKSNNVKVDCFLSNSKKAYVHTRAELLGIDSFTFGRDEFYHSTFVEELLESRAIDYIVLAGFLWLVPVSLTKKFPNKIVNIHPALLPKYGGKGMYGDNVHQAVFANREPETGITIHYVNEHYDDGAIIYQERVGIQDVQGPDEIASRVHVLEYRCFPKVVEDLILRNSK